ncbi:MAG: DinB family protein [candidate division Zixibacteria bacterium]|nr:DinB family protein [candidate division Zixibacteria bacterium]
MWFVLLFSYQFYILLIIMKGVIMPQMPWLERKFNFDFPHELHPEVMERVRGTYVRLKEMTDKCPADHLTTRLEDRWSIQEIVGHLGDCEQLWDIRIDHILEGREAMQGVDFSKNFTDEANHNASGFEDVMARFKSKRDHFIGRMDQLTTEDFARSAIHPRLNKPMRMVDLCFFIAEHDDFHLARMREMLNEFTK